MPRVYIQIEGIEEMIQQIKQIDDRGKAILDKAAMAGAEYAEPKIRQAVPVGDADGRHLRDAIKSKKSRKKSKVKSSASVNVGKSSSPYGFHLEAGTKKMDGKKFIRDTVDHEHLKIAEAMANKFIEGLE